MRPALAILWILAVTPLACSSSASSRSSVAPSKSLNALSTGDLQGLCDWTAQQEGGYGTNIPCDGGGSLEASQDQATCVAEAMQHFDQPSCTSTAEDWMTCIKWRLSNWCSAAPPAPSGQCEAIQTGCYGSGSPDAGMVGSEAGSHVAATLPACTWPASLDPIDASNGQCVAARVYLSCAGSNGGGEGCLSNDPTQCPGPNVTPGVTYSNCQNQCQAHEYAMVCGFIGPAPQDASNSASNPPSGCRIVATNPSGSEPYCCPCGS
jgi:hypothetical protein